MHKFVVKNIDKETEKKVYISNEKTFEWTSNVDEAHFFNTYEEAKENLRKYLLKDIKENDLFLENLQNLIFNIGIVIGQGENMEPIKVNLPSDLESFKTGNGEGVWAYPCSLEDGEKVNDDNYYGEAYVIVKNDSFYYPGLIKYNDIIKVHCNGKNRPYLHIDLFTKYSEKTNPEKNKKEIMEKMKVN